ncbi:MAG: hypothetical protein EXS37_07950 [Opitutus sp.]|nr:hypothetical protein [Opitutus sp.]
MPEILELIPNQAAVMQPLFPDATAYAEFRESFMNEVIPELERLQEARRKSEQESRERLLR